MKYLFLVSFLFSHFCLASEVVFERVNHLGFRKWDHFKTDKNKYYYNGKDLGSSLPAPVLKAWRDLEKEPFNKKTSNTSACSSGVYRFAIKHKGKEQSHRGCTDGKIYSELIQKVENIRNHARRI